MYYIEPAVAKQKRNNF